MRCKTHRRYKAKMKPQCDCLDCWLIYLDTNPPVGIIEQEIHNRTYVPPGYSYVEMEEDKQMILYLLQDKQKEFQGVNHE